MDNHLAVSNDGQVVSVINTHIAIKDKEGNWLGARTLDNFASGLGLSNFKFDPRVLYDPEADRFMMFIMVGSSSNATKIVVAFSQTNDATGMWNRYVLEGNPFDNGTWSDYPIVAFTANEVFLTVNSILDNVSWQLGFFETLVWQMDKQSGYNGEDLQMRLWSDVVYDDKPIRNLCPIKHALGQPDDRMIFLSNRNFDVENDTIFFVEITGMQDDPDTEMLVDVLITDTPYGVSPDALQPNDQLLATNDARVLDGILLEDQIQFVGNCVDPATGQAAIYHGFIDDIYGERITTGTIVNGGNDDIGYPAIAYVGLQPEDRDAIIVVSHSSASRFPGCSALYCDNDRQHSPLVTIKEGVGNINMISGVNRWGDYAGNQLVYNEPGVVWVSASFGRLSNRNDTWIGSLSSPFVVATQEEPARKPLQIQAFPNPSSDRMQVRFELNEVKNLKISLWTQDGRLVRYFNDDRPKKQGLIEFSFNTGALTPGMYFLRIEGDGELLSTETVLVQR